MRTGGREDGEDGAGSHDELSRRQQRHNNRGPGRRATEAAEAGRGRDRGLTLDPPLPFPSTGTGAGAGAAGEAASEQTGTSPGASDAPYEADQFDGEVVVVVVTGFGGVKKLSKFWCTRRCGREKHLYFC